jgi:hypothetical protein
MDDESTSDRPDPGGNQRVLKNTRQLKQGKGLPAEQ